MGELPSTVHDAARALRAGAATSVGLLETCVAQADRYDDALGVYLTRFDNAAHQAAARADEELARGIDRGPLHGIPVGVKDLLAVSEGPTTANSLVLDPAWGAGRDAPVVRRLKRAGAVVTGKVTLNEFALGAPDKEKPFPIPRNPWDLACSPGGSSSGTGVGVAAGFFLAGLGSDTGGSIRVPSAFCGTTGLKPTFGLVPKSGCVPLGFTLDHVGPMARSAWDCAAVLQTIAGRHPSDPTTIDVPHTQYARGLDDDLANCRVGVTRYATSSADWDPAAPPAFTAALTVLESAGAELVEVTVPYYAETTAANLLTMLSEALAYHRGDLQARWNDYHVRTRRTLLWGALVRGSDYVQSQRVRRVAQLALNEVFRDVDVIVSPTATIGAPPSHAFETDEGFAQLMAKVHTMYWDGVGNPVVAVPMGFTAERLPLSLQIAGRPFHEAAILRVAHAFQSRTDWHLSVPDLQGLTA